jgi:hypothetical protein
MGVIERRVDAHLYSVYILLGVDSRTETVSLAMNCGLFDLFFFLEEAMLDEKGLASNMGLKQLVQDLLLSNIIFNQLIVDRSCCCHCFWNVVFKLYEVFNKHRRKLFCLNIVSRLIRPCIPW